MCPIVKYVFIRSLACLVWFCQFVPNEPDSAGLRRMVARARMVRAQSHHGYQSFSLRNDKTHGELVQARFATKRDQFIKYLFVFVRTEMLHCVYSNGLTATV